MARGARLRSTFLIDGSSSKPNGTEWTIVGREAAALFMRSSSSFLDLTHFWSASSSRLTRFLTD